jgi:hypothetical protein
MRGEMIMSAAEIGVVATVGALLLFAFIAVIVVNRSLKQQKKEKA